MRQLATMRDLERLAGSAAAQHERAESCLDAASAVIRGYCGWPISRVEELTVQLDPAGERRLALPCAWLTEVHTVSVNGHPETGYRWSRSGLIERESGRWPAGLGSVEVTFSGGFDPVPPEVIAAAVSYAVKGLSSADLHGPRVTQETVGPVSWTYADPGSSAAELSSAEQAALVPYRLLHPSLWAAVTS